MLIHLFTTIITHQSSCNIPIISPETAKLDGDKASVSQSEVIRRIIISNNTR